MTMIQSTNSRAVDVRDFDFAPAVRLTSTLLKENEIQVKRLSVNYENFSLNTIFHLPVGIIGDVADEYEVSNEQASELLMELMIEKLEDLGIPRNAQKDVRIQRDSWGAWVEVDCTFFLEPKKHLTIDPAIASVIRLDLDFFAVQADLADVLNANLPVDYAADPNASVDEKVNCFAWYLTTALPWEAKWLLEYAFHVDFLIEKDVVTFQYQPLPPEEFAYDSSYDPSDANLIIFVFPAIPAIPH